MCKKVIYCLIKQGSFLVVREWKFAACDKFAFGIVLTNIDEINFFYINK